MFLLSSFKIGLDAGIEVQVYLGGDTRVTMSNGEGRPGKNNKRKKMNYCILKEFVM